MAKIEVNDVKLSGGFSVEESKKKGKVHVYENKSAFTDNLPQEISTNVLKGVNHYQGKYISGCLESAVKLSEKEFGAGSESVTAKFPFGANANSSVTVQINKKVKQVVPTENGVKHIEAPQIKIKVKEQYHGAPTGNDIKDIKSSIDAKFNK